MKPIWKSRKVWIAVIALLAVVVAHATGNPGMADTITLLGGVLVAAFGLGDMGKEGKALEAAVDIQLGAAWDEENK